MLWLSIVTVNDDVACVASVSVRYRSKERPRKGISVLTEREIKREPKNKRGGRGRGRKETLTDKPLDVENLRSPAVDWLG